MPLYEVFHTCSLSNQQQEQIAKGITDIHCGTFAAPSIFVNVIFHEYNDSKRENGFAKTVFIGGRKHQHTNYITAHLRPRPNNRDTLVHITERILALWNTTVSLTVPNHPGSITDPNALHNILLFEDIAAGAEQGFIRPPAGKDREWAEEHRKEFARRAAEGDEGMKVLVGEVGEGKVGGK